MKLVFIYGPPAAGKLTVATELADLTGFRLLDNHSVLNGVTRIFPFSDTEHAAQRRKLGRKVRLDMYEAAALNDIDLITTIGAAGPRYFDFFEDIQNIVEKHGGQVMLVQLLPSMEVLLQRVTSQSRTNLSKIDSREVLTKRLTDDPANFSKYPNVEHLTIDNSNLPADKAAKIIQDHYNL